MDFALVARVAGALVVIAGVLFAFNALARVNVRRAFGGVGSGGRLVTVVETTHLPNAATLHVVRIGDAYAVVGRSGAFVGKVADVPHEAIEAWLAVGPRRTRPSGDA